MSDEKFSALMDEINALKDRINALEASLQFEINGKELARATIDSLREYRKERFSITVTDRSGDLVVNVVGYNDGDIKGIAKDGYEVDIKGEA